MKKSRTKKSAAVLAGMLMGVSNSLLNLRNKMLPAEAVLMDYTLNAFVSHHAINVVVRLGIADMLNGEPVKVTELAEKANVREEALYRVLRGVSCMGIFNELPGKKFQNNKLGRSLRTDNKYNILGLVKYVGADWNHFQWVSFMKCVENNQDLYVNLYQKRYYQWFEDNPEASTVFNEGMISLSAVSDNPIATSYNFGSFNSVCDIAGGVGGQLAAILKLNPHMKACLFELDQVLKEVDEHKVLDGFEHKVEMVSGNFFESPIPVGYDLYFLKSIIHNWEDENAIKILNNIKRSMKKGARILIAELLITKPNKREAGKLLDLGMLAITGGIERTKDEYAELFGKCGLKLTKLVKTTSPYCLMEVMKENN